MHVRPRFGDEFGEPMVVRQGQSTSVGSNSACFPVNEAGIKSIVVVDDDARFGGRLLEYFSRACCLARASPLSIEALVQSVELRPDFLLIDICPNGRPMWEYLSTILSHLGPGKVIVMSMYPSAAFAAECMRRGAADFIPKPISADAVWLSLVARKTGRSVPDSLRLPTLAYVEWEYIRHVLRLVDGNVTRAASALGIRRQSLQRKLRILPPDDRE